MGVRTFFRTDLFFDLSFFIGRKDFAKSLNLRAVHTLERFCFVVLTFLFILIKTQISPHLLFSTNTKTWGLHGYQVSHAPLNAW